MRRVSASRRSPSKSGSAPATTNSCGTPPASKRAAPEAAQLDRVVDQLVVVGRLVDAAAAASTLTARIAVATCQPRGSVPICSALRLGLAALHAQAQRWCR